MDKDNNEYISGIFSHIGEEKMRQKFPSRYCWNDDNLSLMMQPIISPQLAKFIAKQCFFFIATADDNGHCDASFRGAECGDDGVRQPACIVRNETTIIFPDFSGNGLYNSLGNITVNGHIGMLFIDFEHQMRARVNGRAHIIAVDDKSQKIWPRAQAIIEVKVDQAYRNCPVRIPKMKM